MKHFFFLFTLFFNPSVALAQQSLKFESTLAVEYFSHLTTMLQVDPGPGWKGYYLPEDSQGFKITSMNGIVKNQSLHIGLGLSYARLAQVDGALAFVDMRFDFSKKRLAPYFYLNPGYSHFWNQYEGGTGSFNWENGLGARYRIRGKSSVLASVGLAIMQQGSMFLTTKVGYTF
ncbi:hypothetical protein [Siphonobacter sp. SORGH_AS_1065]|uniref:hypothetical protein n=1 Tax=Siphonobacter sp. SORGH_AS_1065 TaxID=3041795 RepID=UPI002785C0B6|nr:hypothetical protein [Siphonobacter sp. SORGH_AS_1065]MDQ1090033.1 hypothetical protein [Siphonobacter sp. SORGH_AS_1065]